MTTNPAILRAGHAAVWLPEELDAELHEVMCAAYVEVANESHHDRMARVYRALRQALAKRDRARLA